jgi:hypothetical protein
MLTLREIVATQTAAADELPLVHTTRCEILELILKSHELRAGECEVFHEHLLYFFYGRPAYRHRDHHQPGGGVELCPVCFVFRPHTIGALAKRVFVCDSGGVHHQKFMPHLDQPDLPDLELNAEIDSARKLVPLVFGSNTNYFRGQVVNPAPVQFAGGSVARRYHDLQLDRNPQVADDRRSAIEFQLDSPLPLEHRVLYVVLPSEMMNREDVRLTLRKTWQCDPIFYETVNATAPNENVVTIRDILRERFRQGGLL